MSDLQMYKQGINYRLLTSAWEKEYLGEASVYPGHAVVLACMIMDRYPDLASAQRRCVGATYPNALGDQFIPGAGGAVYAALDVLELAVTQQNLPAAYARAEYCWNCWEQESAEHNKVNAERGRAQYEKLKEHFARRVKEWGTAADTSTRYRVQA